MAAPAAADHRFDRRMVGRQVIHRQVAAFGLLELHDLPRDVAAIERVVRGVQPGEAVGAGGAVLVRHELQRARQVGLHEFLPRPRDAVVRQENRGVGLPAAVLMLVRGDRARPAADRPRSPRRRNGSPGRRRRRSACVPWRRSAVIQASGAAGITVRSTPSGILPPCSRMNRSAGIAFGHQPRPAMLSTVPSARRMMIGATPATFTRSGCSTPSAMPAAQPASIALPPASRMEKPAAAAR